MEATTERRAVAARSVADWPEHYSARNCMILAAAGASEVAGFAEWIELGRVVRKGEKAIRLTAPRTVKDEETGEARMVGVTDACVFDVSQTDELGPEELEEYRRRRAEKAARRRNKGGRRRSSSGVSVVRLNSGAVLTQNKAGRCEDAPCCGCCS